jgi:hypothetical protein
MKTLYDAGNISPETLNCYCRRDSGISWEDMLNCRKPGQEKIMA